MSASAPETQRTTERLALLVLTMPRAVTNYTEALAAASWIIEEGERVGWSVHLDYVFAAEPLLEPDRRTLGGTAGNRPPPPPPPDKG